jgi:hypothetical protein
MRVTLAFEASALGNAEVVFGRTNAAGELRLSGVRAVTGFDQAAWTFRRDAFRKTLEAPGAGPAFMPRRLDIRILLDSAGAPIRLLSFTVDGAAFALPQGGAADVLESLDPREWDTFKAVARGDASAAEASVRLYPVGTLMILR